MEKDLKLKDVGNLLRIPQGLVRLFDIDERVAPENMYYMGRWAYVLPPDYQKLLKFFEENGISYEVEGLDDVSLLPDSVDDLPVWLKQKGERSDQSILMLNPQKGMMFVTRDGDLAVITSAQTTGISAHVEVAKL